LKWFRRWKNPDQSDWEAFCRQLKFPLSPQRAKGLTLNIEGRRAAGLDAALIAELNVYSQSKGRTPRVFVAASRRGRTLAQAGNGGVQAHSGIPAWQRGDASQSVSTIP
jgi:hypothetical protein